MTLFDKVADVKGIPIMIGILLVILNFVFRAMPALNFLTPNDLVLHLGIVIGMGGTLLWETL